MRVLKSLCLTLALAALMLTATPRQAQADSTYDKVRLATTTPGKEVMIGHHSNNNGKCQIIRTPNITVLTPPGHGTISTRPGAYVVNDVASHCNGREVQGVIVLYTPAAGFTGDDKLVYTVAYGTSIQTNTITVSVH